MAQPKVSILVPTYNAIPFLEQALDSLTAQTLTDIEIICLNDGSTDESAAVLEDYASRDPRFVVIHKRNSGYGATMNLGLDRATGEYIGILEPDDYASPLMFERLYRAATDSAAQVAKANFNAIRTDNGISIDKIDLFASLKNRIGKPFRPLDEISLFRVRPAIWSGLYQTTFLRRAGIRFLESAGASYQDAGFNFKVWAAASRVVLLDQAYLYYRTDNAASSVKDPGKVWAVADEYASISEFVTSLPHADQLIPILQGARFEAYRWNLERLAPEIRHEFFEHVEETYRQEAEQGRLEARYFNGNNWAALQQLLETPQLLRDAGHLLYPVRRDPASIPAATAPASRSTDSLISVIIPVFNSEKFLSDCLDSVLAQTHTDLEVLCVDDGSTDLSPEILAVYAARDPRVRVITQANGGAGVARNTGIEAARGAYFSFLDADDVFDARMLERAYAACRDAGADFCVYGADSFNHGAPAERQPIAHGIRRHLLPRTSSVISPADIPRDVFSVFQGWAWDKLYRAEFVRESQLTFQGLRTTNDLRFVMTALACAARIVVIDDVLVHQRRQVLTSLSRTREQSWDNFYRALLGLRDELLDRGLYERYRKDFVNYALQLTLWNLRTLDGISFHLLYDSLKSGWLTELGVTPNGPRYFFSGDDFVALQRILKLSSHEYLHQVLGRGPSPLQSLPPIAKGTPDESAVSLSVIVPVYNMADYIEECLDSVLAFEGAALEVICVDDGSTDGSGDILSRYEGLSDRVVVVRRENGGLSEARNSGLAVARGTYVCFLDSDDFFRPVDLPGMIERALAADLDVLAFDAHAYRDAGVTDAQWSSYDGYYTRLGRYDEVASGPQLLADMRANGEYRVSCCLYIVRRELLREANVAFISGIAHEDNAFTFAVMVAAKRASHVGVELYGRRVRAGSIMTAGSHLRSARGYLVALGSMMDTLAGWRGDEFVAGHLGGVVFQVLHNAQAQFAQLPASQLKELTAELQADPRHHFLSLTTRRLARPDPVHSR